MNHDPHQTLHDAAPRPLAPVPFERLWARGRRRRVAIRGGGIIAAMAAIGLAVTFLPGALLDGSDPVGLEVTDQPAGVIDPPAGDTERPMDRAEGMLVVVSDSILGDVVSQLVDDDVRIEVLIGRDEDEPRWQPSTSDEELVRAADLVIISGLDSTDHQLWESASQDGVPVVEFADHLDLITELAVPGSDQPSADGEEVAPAALDRHVWLDPVRMADGVMLLADELVAASDQLDPHEVRDRAESYVSELLVTHERMSERFAELAPDARRLVTNHFGLGYLADRYDLQIVWTFIPDASSPEEARAGLVRQLAATVDEQDVPAIFYRDPMDGTRDVDPSALEAFLARELSGDRTVTVVPLVTDTLGPPGSDTDTYLGLLETTTSRIVDPLR